MNGNFRQVFYLTDFF